MHFSALSLRFVMASIATMLVVTSAIAAPSQAAGSSWQWGGAAWPNKTQAMPAAAKQPWQCGLKPWVPGYGQCREWRVYMDAYGDLVARGTASQKSVGALMATSGRTGVARQAGAVAFGNSACGWVLRAQSVALLNKTYADGQLVKNIDQFFGKKMQRRTTMYWPMVEQVSKMAVKITSRHATRVTSNQILFAAETAGCLR